MDAPAGVETPDPTIAPSPKPRPLLLERVEVGLARVEAALMTLLLVGLILLAVVHVLAFIKFQLIKDQALETAWFKPLFGQGVFAIGFLGTAIATQENKLFRVDFVVTFLSPRGRLVWRTIGSLFSLGSMLVLVWLGLRCIPSLPADPIHVSGFMRKVLTSCTDWISGTVEQGSPFITTRQTFRLMLGLFLLCAFHFLLRLAIDGMHLLRGTVPPDVVDAAPAEARKIGSAAPPETSGP